MKADNVSESLETLPVPQDEIDEAVRLLTLAADGLDAPEDQDGIARVMAWLERLRAVAAPEPEATVPVAWIIVNPFLERMLSWGPGKPAVMGQERAFPVYRRSVPAPEPAPREAIEALERLEKVLPLFGALTVRDVLNAGDAAIDAAGLNPWCVNEGRATGDEPLSLWWLDDAIATIRSALLRERQK